MSYVTPILGMIFTALTTLTGVTFCLAMRANASPRDIRVLKAWTAGLTVLGIAGVVYAIVLLRAGEMGRATVAAFGPAGVMVVIFVVAIWRSGK